MSTLSWKRSGSDSGVMGRSPWVRTVPGVALALALLVAGCSGGINPEPAGSVPVSFSAAATTSAEAEPSGDAASSAGVEPAGDVTASSVSAETLSEPPTASLTGSILDTPAGVAETAPAPEQVSLGFESNILEIDAALAARMAASWRPGCPVSLADLRYLTVTYRGFDGQDHSGELVVAATVAADVASAFEQLYAAGFPIASMRLVDDFGASDDASMATDNTSAFNCRAVTGGSSYSEHSYGTAIDINPIENPYIRGNTVLPPVGSGYASRPESPGVIQAGDAVVTAFESIGWSWGGYWTNPTDYQHFSLSGR